MSMSTDSTNRGDITRFLEDAASGDGAAVSRLWAEVQEDVHDMAVNICRREYTGITIQPTLLVNEVWMRLYGKSGAPLTWENRAHFFGSAARSMGQILIDYARKRNTVRRGGNHKKVSLELIPGELSKPELELNVDKLNNPLTDQ